MSTITLLVWFVVAAPACKLLIVPSAVTVPSQAQFQFRTKVQPVETCPQPVTCKATAGTITEDTCILVAPRVLKTTVVTVTATSDADAKTKASARVTVEP